MKFKVIDNRDQPTATADGSDNLAEAAGLEPAHALRGDLANRCHTVRRRLLRLAEGTGLEPASDKCAVVFGTTALPVRLPFQRRISDYEFRIADWLAQKATR